MNEAEVSASITARIRDFYDRHPYPPAVRDLEDYRRKWQDESRLHADFHLFWRAKPYREDLDILVAGCGTTQAARYAMRFPHAGVLGIDVSQTSIQESKGLKERYNLSNLELLKLPVERVRELNRRFDKIICTGVLHHLPDPAVGLRALRDVLNADGAMHLMVYAEYGRVGIYMIQEYCRRLGIVASDEEISDLAHALMALPMDHPLARLLAESPDFRRRAALADALLNPQDRAYTVPQLFELIDGAGLAFGRWLRQAPYLPYCGDLANTPHTERLSRLAEHEQYAAVELFRGTMLRHSAIVYRGDNPYELQPIQFAGDRWRHYVPHRLPETITVRENIPAGAVAVLINKSHTYPDIYLPIYQKEMQMLEAINGQRTIAEIGQQAAVKEPDSLRIFFQKLWRYDQIIFAIPG